MKILHRIGFAATSAQKAALEALAVAVPAGIAMPGGDHPFVAFDVAEDDPSWPAVQTLLREWGISDGFVRTEFSEKEMESARWLALGALHHRYPQPDEGAFGYRKATYDLTDWCEKCGVGLKQRAPFQMKGEPKWGRRALLQLHWVDDEVFATPEAWTRVFEPRGIGCRPVMNTNGIALKTVVQLVVDEVVGIVTEGLASERCPTCERLKYLPVARGPFPPLVRAPSAAMVRTSEYFGSGAQADQRPIVSQDIAGALAANKIRGAFMTPVDIEPVAAQERSVATAAPRRGRAAP